MRNFAAIFGALMLLLPQDARANYCPVEVGIVEGADLDKKTANVLSELYRELGCTLTLRHLPSKRVIRDFNGGRLDGEVMRLHFVEKHYTREFVRSKTPLFTTVNGLWHHPNPQVVKNRPTGIVFGLAWQDKFVQERTTRNKRFKTFYNHQELLEAYEEETIGSFLLASPTLKLALTEKKISKKPVLAETISKAVFRHYLGAQFDHFMTDLSTLLKQKRPFKDFDLSPRETKKGWRLRGVSNPNQAVRREGISPFWL